MKTIIASLICAVVAIGCIGLAPSKAEAGWYGRGVGVSIRVGPRYGYRPYGYYGGHRRYGYYGGYRPYGYYGGYRRHGYYGGYRPHRGYWAGRAYRRWR
jgi:hypothetical protein